MINLMDYYTSSNRHYHNLLHINYMLEGLRLFERTLSVKDRAILVEAIKYHDAIYRAGNPNNEAFSAELLLKHSALQGLEKIEAMRLILLTKHHVTVPEDVSGSIIIDLDLAGLALPWYKYSENISNVRKEFSAFSDEQWTAGRKAFLTGFLSRDRIFYTEHGSIAWEDKARENMRRELEELG